MPDSMETSYTDWVGRKHAKLKRSTLDCGHANTGDVHYHYWCDRLSCSEECANAGHDCGQFKGKSSSEGEAVEPEAVVDPPAPRPLTLSPETYRALYGDEPLPAAALDELVEPDHGVRVTEEHIASVLATSSEEEFRAESLGVWPPDPDRAQVAMMTEGEAVQYRRVQMLSLECSRRRPMCSGCDGGAIDGFSCIHDCHPATPGLLAHRAALARYASTRPDPAVRPVAAALQPDPDGPERTCILASCVEVGRHNHLEPPPSTSLYCAGCGRDITYSGVCSRCPEPSWAAEMRARMARDTRPWWRRMLPGGTR